MSEPIEQFDAAVITPAEKRELALAFYDVGAISLEERKVGDKSGWYTVPFWFSLNGTEYEHDLHERLAQLLSRQLAYAGVEFDVVATASNSAKTLAFHLQQLNEKRRLIHLDAKTRRIDGTIGYGDRVLLVDDLVRSGNAKQVLKHLIESKWGTCNYVAAGLNRSTIKDGIISVIRDLRFVAPVTATEMFRILIREGRDLHGKGQQILDYLAKDDIA